MGDKPLKYLYALVVPCLLFLCAVNSFAGAGGDLAGKTLWVVDVNTNEYYKASLQQALIDQLPQFAQGVIVRHVITAEKGNPFFLLKKEDYPDAVIVSLGMCDASSKNVANYASEARKSGIPTAMVYYSEVREMLAKWNKAYRNPEERTVEIEKLPQSREEAMPVAKRIIPEVLEKLKP